MPSLHCAVAPVGSVLTALPLPVAAAGAWVDFIDGWGEGAGVGSAVGLALGALELLGGTAGVEGVVVVEDEALRFTPPW